ncbi:MAG: helix-turn-helix transcriptional regulator, partial [Peptococcaceae bacterium]|nr:helix-turn-helix transcriptional regulator [Peptococcaceae bacterium]
LLRAEWQLLSIYLHFPLLDKMLPITKKAAILFDGANSQVILPEAPWAFFECFQLIPFHVLVGAADREANMLEEFITLYSRLTNGHGSGADALFRAELAFMRGDRTNAEIFAYKAIFLAESKQQQIIQIGATKLLASIALIKSDADGWQNAISAMERAATGSTQNTSMLRTLLDVICGTLLAELRDFSRIADWLKRADTIPRQLPVAIYNTAVAVHMLYLMGQGDFPRLVGFGLTIPLNTHTVFINCIHYFLMAVGYASLENRTLAAENLKHSAEKSLPDGMIHCLAGFSPLLQGLPEELMENNYPHLCSHFKEYKEQYVTGWITLHSTIVAHDLPSGLTGREQEIALLAADGLRNNEIAKKLFVSENTVRAHLRSIYHKLDIDRRAKLVKKLK